jgi:hypothetical protein
MMVLASRFKRKNGLFRTLANNASRLRSMRAARRMNLKISKDIHRPSKRSFLTP